MSSNKSSIVRLAKDVKKSVELLFSSLNDDGLYIIEDIQSSYNHFFGGTPFDLKYSNSLSIRLFGLTCLSVYRASKVLIMSVISF